MQTFTMLIGPPSSGKTTWTSNQKGVNDGTTLVVSSDAIREELNLPPHGKENHAKVFEEMKYRTWAGLVDGYSVIYDATNLSGKIRKRTLTEIKETLAKEYPGVKIKYNYVLFSETIETLVERDAKRERTVGRDVIINLLKAYTQPNLNEGFDYGHTIYSKDRVGISYYQKMAEDFEQDSKWHTGTLFEHLRHAYSYLHNGFQLKGIELPSSLRLTLHNAIAWHDVGKLYTKAFVDGRGNKLDSAIYYNHSNISSYLSNQGEDGPSELETFLIEKHMVDLNKSPKMLDNNSYTYIRALQLFQECDHYRPAWFDKPTRGDND